MRLEVGKAYKTRHGRRAMVHSRSDFGNFPMAGRVEGMPGEQSWNDDGSYHMTRESPLDLVAPWEEPATPDADGWIKWDGGECPVASETMVDIKVRCGDILLGNNAGGWNWLHGNHCTERRQIIAYRIVKPAADERAEGIEADLDQLIRVAVTNPSDLLGFIRANYPEQFSRHASPSLSCILTAVEGGE